MMFQHLPTQHTSTDTQTHTSWAHHITHTSQQTSGIVIICAFSPRSASVFALRCLLHGDIRKCTAFSIVTFSIRSNLGLFAVRQTFGHCRHLGSNVEGVSSSFCAMCLERVPCVEWDDPFETTFWSWGNLRLPALHGVLVDHQRSE